MKIFYNLLSKLLPTQTAYAHCDIPCGIYDPHGAQMAAHTVLRMTKMLTEANEKEMGKEKYLMHSARLTRVKEQHGNIVEEELGTLENDYFKPEHFEKFPDLKKTIEEAVKLSIKTRQNIDEAGAKDLIQKTMQIAEVFYKTKNLEPVRVPSGYPTEGEIVVQK